MAESLLILDDIRMQQVLQNAEIKREFPFLGTASARVAQATRETCCNKKKKPLNSSTSFNDARRSITHLDPTRLRLLKKLLGNPKRVRVVYNNGHGKAIQFTF